MNLNLARILAFMSLFCSWLTPIFGQKVPDSLKFFGTDTLKFFPIFEKDRTMTAYPADSSATAVVLSDSGSMLMGGYFYIFTRK
jgi:hypothetical protein